MARYRTLKPELFSDEKLTECSRDARLLFIGLWPFVDDMGRAQLSYRQLKNQIFPGDLDIGPKQVEQWFAELVRVGVVEIYELTERRKTQRYFRIPHFLNHQRIDRPTHTSTPRSPTEDATQLSCLCRGCKARDRILFPQERSEDSMNGRRALDDDAASTRRARSLVVGVGVVVGGGSGVVGGDGESTARTAQAAQPQPRQNTLDTSGKDRNSPSSAAAEISGRILDLLAIPRNHKIIQVLTDTIVIKAEVEMLSIENMANKIAGRAAVIARESPPEAWELWFADARYDYVPQGDKRINQRGQMARPVCGGALCSQGWEPVLVEGVRRLRRCPDCVRAWRDAGVE